MEPAVQLSDAEWKVMNAVWRKSPAGVREVHEQLKSETGWAFTTVKTMLTRLVEKGVLTVEKQGNARMFSPVVQKTQARKQAVNALIDKAFDGAFGPLLHYLLTSEKLTKQELQELQQFLQQDEQRPRDKRG